MPDIVAHRIMADKVLQRIGTGIGFSADYDYIHFASFLPDLFFFFRFCFPFIRQGINRRSLAIHNKPPTDLFIELAKSRNTETLSFLYGMICHYALDCTVHPYINSFAQKDYRLHAAIEHRIDRTILKRQGLERKDVMKFIVPYCESEDMKKAFTKLYGWNGKHYHAAYIYYKMYFWIIKDQHGLLEKIGRRSKGKLAVRSYGTHLADGVDLGFYDGFEKEAIEFGTKIIIAVNDYRRGIIKEQELRKAIGNKAFSGIAC